MTRKDPFQPDNHVLLENVTTHDKSRQISVNRSQSFAGMASKHEIYSPTGAPVLGESLRAKSHWTINRPQQNSRSTLGVNRKSPKIPKIPRPNRALLMFESVKKGVRELIEATKEDIDVLHSRGIDQTSTAQQIKSAERYLKRLEFHLAKIEELHDHYLVQKQMRDGTRTMQRAFITSPHRRKDSMERVRYGIKECSQTMCSIEAQLEAMMGTFQCKSKGMAGFARLCPGDVFEINIKHGNQKWKSRGRIEKTGNQKWDNCEYKFKAIVGDVMRIKGVEVRSFKSVLLGEKSCETKDLFSANPQLMTVSINSNGSLKYSIIITWNPLDGVEDSMQYYEVPLRPQTSPRKRPVSVLALNGELSGSYSNLSGNENSLNMVTEGHSVASSKNDPCNVEEATNILSTTLEDYHGQYRELEKLEDVIVMLEHVLRKESRCSSRSSSISVSIESALEAFDFLNTEEEVEETEKPSDSSAFDNVISSPESTAKTADSGIESLAKRLSEDTTLGSSLGSSPLPPSTGNEQVDQALIFHLVYCERLLESLGNFGPLKCREIYALDKLQKQADIVEHLVKISQSGAEVDLLPVMTELTGGQKFTRILVLRHLVMRILDVPNYDPDKIKPTCIVTLHQFIRYFKDEGGLQNVDAVAAELQMIEKLCSPNSDMVVKTIMSLQGSLPPGPCMKVLGALLVSNNREISNCVGEFNRHFSWILACLSIGLSALLVFVEGLEDKTAEVRAGCCDALSILEATESIDRLAYLCQTDTSSLVKTKAKETLLTFGEVGRKTFEEIQLSSHGFQGLQVRK
ncbi:hypothetical protein FSP39_012348 [Pinctada imbricata]|uniref:FAM65 N-terminal domain-containing protein n=1 Tax=Pinctada imbricata TaxID=66713 RepID=A0AA88YJN3_PINIB|nr:hypothetical protein FSP39_012348 [Pinctada imbricata]